MTSRLARGVSAAALLATLGLAGCGGGDDENVAQFVGIWNYTTGTRTTSCGGGPSVETLKGNVTLGRGVDAPLVMVFEPCTQGLKLDVTGTNANIRSGQMCTGMLTANDGSPVTITYIFNAGAFNITGKSATLSAGGTANAIVQGSTVPCTFTETGTANKVSQ